MCVSVCVERGEEESRGESRGERAKGGSGRHAPRARRYRRPVSASTSAVPGRNSLMLPRRHGTAAPCAKFFQHRQVHTTNSSSSVRKYYCAKKLIEDLLTPGSASFEGPNEGRIVVLIRPVRGGRASLRCALAAPCDACDVCHVVPRFHGLPVRSLH